MKDKLTIMILVVSVLWIIMHIPGLIYGTKEVSLHQSYIGDEQSPINGALHILEKKSLLGLRNNKNLYYGPVLAVIALPGVISDFGIKYLTSAVKTAKDYKESIIWNWGGIILNIRIIAVIFSLIGLYFFFKILLTKTLNKNSDKTFAYISTITLALNFYYFEYSHFFKHWAFVVTLLLIQIYSAIRIYETDGREKKYWFIHIITTLTSFGISYVSIIFSLMWLPILISYLREKNWPFIKMFIWPSFYLSCGIALIFLWHPYAFIRYLGFIGIGEPTGGLNNTQNPFMLSNISLGFYGREISLNHLPLVILFTLSVFVLYHIYKSRFDLWFYAILIPAILNFTFFALAEHHEGRYMLPTITLFILLLGILLIKMKDNLNYEWKYKKIFFIAIYTLLFLNITFHLIHIAKWMQIYSEGPIGERLVSKVLEIQKPKDKILVIGSYILGHSHTKGAYLDYMKNTNKENLNLYKEILNTPLPENMVPVNAYYLSEADFMDNPKVMKSFDHVFIYREPRKELNLFDFFDENILRLWNYIGYSPSFFMLK